MRLVRAEYEYDAAANAVLLAVDNAFSDLVASLMTVQVTLAQKSILADIRARTRRGYELGEVNQYSLDQVEARYAATLTQEALAWNGFVSASEALSNLLYGDVFELILPAAYAEYLARATHVDLGKAMQAALERNATVKRAEILVEESRIALNHRLADTRPDLLLSAGLSFGQNAQVVGYEDLGSSLRNVFNPDVRTVSVALTFRLPIGNTAVKAALSAARIDLLQARDQLTQARSLVVQNLSTSADALQSAQKQVEVARINTGLAEEAFAAANRRRAQNLATEFERLEVENDLLSARLGYVDALVQYRKNVAQFLASQNLLLETVQ
jgi:outer membrane protein TolC